MIWIYLPLPVPSLVFGFIHSYMLKYDKSFSSGKIVVGKAGIICVPIVFLGKCLVKAFMSKINQETGTLLFLIIFSIINLLLSLGLLNIQRLYYYSKQKRTDQSGDGSDQSGDGSMIDKQTET
ncbi:MAG: hypothetical protein IJ333_05670 [Clostridia bacterium]|nr:hypothetical protein [Clostridia bacterium]